MFRVILSLPDYIVQRVDQKACERSRSRNALIAMEDGFEHARRYPEVIAPTIKRSEKRITPSVSQTEWRWRSPTAITVGDNNTHRHIGPHQVVPRRWPGISRRHDSQSTRQFRFTYSRPHPYEAGNALFDVLGSAAYHVVGQADDDLIETCEGPLFIAPWWFRETSALGLMNQLGFSTATWVVRVQARGVSVVSPGSRFFAAGPADSPKAIFSRLGLLRPPRGRRAGGTCYHARGRHDLQLCDDNFQGRYLPGPLRHRHFQDLTQR